MTETRATHPSGVHSPAGQFAHPTICDNCRGTGRVWASYPATWVDCGRCNGTGHDPRIIRIVNEALEGLLERTRQRCDRILAANHSNAAKALARDARELCELVDDYRAERTESRAREPEAVTPHKEKGS